VTVPSTATAKSSLENLATPSADVVAVATVITAVEPVTATSTP